jgi:hypothetical protein
MQVTGYIVVRLIKKVGKGWLIFIFWIDMVFSQDFWSTWYQRDAKTRPELVSC